MLSVSVAPSVSVESGRESKDVLIAVSLSGMMFLCYSKKPPLAATQAFSLRSQALPIVSNISRLPAHVL